MALLVMLVVGAMPSSTTRAQPSPHKVPRRAQPATTSRSAPEPTGTIAKPEPNKAEAMVPPIDEEALPTPFDLPKASRARMRLCGLKWQQIKMSGKAGDEIWRDFATTCLGAISDPDLDPDRTAQQSTRQDP
jgi:hypothetical protein